MLTDHLAGCRRKPRGQVHGQRVLRVPASRSPGRRAQPHPVSAASLLAGLQLPLRQGGGGGSAAGRRLAVAWYVITFVLCGWLWPGTSSFCALWLAVAWSSLLCFVVGCGLVRHHFCALWLAVAWYVITFVLCGWLWPGSSVTVVLGCGLVRQSLLCLAVAWYVSHCCALLKRETETERQREHR